MVIINWTGCHLLQPIQVLILISTIYHSPTPGGPFTLIDSVMDYSTTQYTHSGPDGKSFYYIMTKGGCDYLSPPSDTLETIELSVQALSGGSVAQLDWNAPITPLPNSVGLYYIYREFPTGVWTVIDSTTLLTYNDTITICSSTIDYQIGLEDTVANCISYSNIAGDLFADIIAPPLGSMDSASVDPATGLAVLGWPVSNTPDAVSYIIYLLDPSGAWNPIDTIFDINTTNYINSGSTADQGFEQYAVATLDSCDNRSPISPLHRTVFFEAQIDLCLQEVALSWSSFNSIELSILKMVELKISWQV